MKIQFHHALEDVFGLFTVSVLVRRENEEVVHIDDEPSFGNHISKGIIHELLERCGRIGKSEEHYCWFEEAFVSDESSFPLVAVFDVDIVIAPVDIKLCE